MRSFRRRKCWCAGSNQYWGGAGEREMCVSEFRGVLNHLIQSITSEVFEQRSIKRNQSIGPWGAFHIYIDWLTWSCPSSGKRRGASSRTNAADAASVADDEPDMIGAGGDGGDGDGGGDAQRPWLDLVWCRVE